MVLVPVLKNSEAPLSAVTCICLYVLLTNHYFQKSCRPRSVYGLRGLSQLYTLLPVCGKVRSCHTGLFLIVHDPLRQTGLSWPLMINTEEFLDESPN